MACDPGRHFKVDSDTTMLLALTFIVCFLLTVELWFDVRLRTEKLLIEILSFHSTKILVSVYSVFNLLDLLVLPTCDILY